MPKGWPRARIDLNSAGVDKSSFPGEVWRRTAVIQAIQKRCKKGLASGSESCDVGFARSTSQFQKPASAGFLFSGVFYVIGGFPSDMWRDGRESIWATSESA